MSNRKRTTYDEERKRRRRETIVWLLEHLEDVLMERTESFGKSKHESVSLQAGPLWNDAFRELERCLALMRNRGCQQAVSYEGGSCSLRCAAWHVNAWYVQVERRQTLARQAFKKRNGKQGTILVPVVEVQRHRDAREAKALAGVDWIVEEFQWESGQVQRGLAQIDKVRGKQLPVEAVKVAA